MKIILALILICFGLNSYAQSCIGTWISIDDKTGKKKSKVELYKKDDILYGKIIYLYPREGREENPKCKKCSGDRKDQPLVGLQIIRGLKWDGGEWEDGTIVDPETGKVYDCTIWVDKDKPNELNVRGYIGPFFRTQTWIKEQ